MSWASKVQTRVFSRLQPDKIKVISLRNTWKNLRLKTDKKPSCFQTWKNHRFQKYPNLWKVDLQAQINSPSDMVCEMRAEIGLPKNKWFMRGVIKSTTRWCWSMSSKTLNSDKLPLAWYLYILDSNKRDAIKWQVKEARFDLLFEWRWGKTPPPKVVSLIDIRVALSLSVFREHLTS